jgi:hypothetical protein
MGRVPGSGPGRSFSAAVLGGRVFGCLILLGLGVALLGRQPRLDASPPGTPAKLLPGELVSPRPVLPLRFSHAKHSGSEFPCATCHVKATTSTASSDLLLPGMKDCVGCHEEARVPKGHGSPGMRDLSKCRKCHTAFNPKAFPEPVSWRAPRFRFSHRLHLDKGATCLGCHPGVERASRGGVADGLHLPRMKDCLVCHRGSKALGGAGPGGGGAAPSKGGGEAALRYASARCVTCHEREPGGRIRARFPDGDLRPGAALPHLQHGPSFSRDHRVAARAHRTDCEACHRQDQCLRCHGGVRRPASIHLGNWTLLHGREARANRQKCQSCHTRQRFCASCHRRVGLSPTSAQSPFGVPGIKRFHGERWASSAGGGAAQNRHAVGARRNVSSCASCHRESDCLRCHARKRVGGLGRSPHGPGFRHSRRCRTLLRKNQRSCLKCHGFDDPLLVLCR